MPDETGEEEYEIAINGEEQYSIWPVKRELPAGWRLIGWRGPKQACLERIEEIWTDMRPLSLRKKMDAAKEKSSAQDSAKDSG